MSFFFFFFFLIGKQDLYLTTKNVENSWHFVK
jgi:hypothetical protein